MEKANYPKRTIIDNLFPFTEHGLLWKYHKRLRITEYHLNKNHKIAYWISRILLYRMQFKYGMKLRLNSCGKGLRIVHPGDITTNGDIGCNAKLFPNALVGANGRCGSVPVIGNDVIICQGAVVIGPIHIADKIIIGANSVVSNSFEEEDITIAGAPARKISDAGTSAWR